MSSRKLGFIDVGARGGLADRVNQFRRQLRVVLVEPEASEYKRLQNDSYNSDQYILVGKALSDVDATANFFETVNSTCSSFLQVNSDFVKDYGISNSFNSKSQSFIECARYDTLFNLGGLPVPHIIKIDVQGFEFQVLQGFGDLLHQCLAIKLETHFYGLYIGQKLFGDLVDYLRLYGFALRKLGNGRSPDLDGDPHFDGELVEVDATFTKNRKWFNQSSEEDRVDLRLACEIAGVSAYR